MDFELKWTERSCADIEAIVRYIARRNPEAALWVGAGIFERAQQLSDHPDLGSFQLSRPEGEWRRLVFRRWKIIYSVRGENILIGRVWPCSMKELHFDRSLESDPD